MDFSDEFYSNKIYIFYLLLLRGYIFIILQISEFNVNVSQLPFGTKCLFCWKCINYDKLSDWLLFGLFAKFGILAQISFLFISSLELNYFFISD